MNYPAVRLNVDRVHAAELGLSQKEIVDNVITALNSNTMIAPNYWVDHQTGNDYFLTVQYYEHGQPGDSQLRRSEEIPLRAPNLPGRRRSTSVVKLEHLQTPTEVDHYQIQRVADVYVTPSGEDLGKVSATHQQSSSPDMKLTGQRSRESPRHGARHARVVPELRYRTFSFGRSSLPDSGGAVPFFQGSFLIMLAIPMGFIGVLVILPLTHTTLNVMSLMGVLMLVGICRFQ